MKSQKKKYIEGLKLQSKKYRAPWGHRFFNSEECPMCGVEDYCLGGCPLTKENPAGNEKGSPDKVFRCFDMSSYKKAKKGFDRLDISPGDRFPVDKLTPVPASFVERAVFLDSIIPILETLPAKRFTLKGWTGFPEIEQGHTWKIK